MIDIQIVEAVNKNPLLFPDELRRIAEDAYGRAFDLIEEELSEYEIASELFDEAYDKVVKANPASRESDFNNFYKAWDEAYDMYEQIAEILEPVISGDWMFDYYDDVEKVEPEIIEDEWQYIYEDALEKIKAKFGKYVAEAIKENISSIVLELGGGFSKLNKDYMSDIGTDFIEESIKNAVLDEMYNFIGDYNDKNIKFKLLIKLLREQ